MAPTNLLLVDDEQSFVEIMSQRLRRRGFIVAYAFSGQEALNRLEADDSIDVVILDVKMPGMDGLETLNAIKNAHPLMEVIMLTGHATVESAIDGMKMGAFDYLMKPCDIEQLIAKVEEATAKKRDHEDKIRDAQVKEALTGHGLG